MRTVLLVLATLATLATGCLTTEAETTSTETSDLTYSFYSPRFEILARIARYRSAADELRAVGATKPPAYATWTVLLQYKSLVQLDHDAADQLDEAADSLSAQLESAKDDLDSLAEMSEMDQLMLQMAMDRQVKAMSTISSMLKKMHETTQTIVDNLKA